MDRCYCKAFTPRAFTPRAYTLGWLTNDEIGFTLFVETASATRPGNVSVKFGYKSSTTSSWRPAREGVPRGRAWKMVRNA